MILYPAVPPVLLVSNRYYLRNITLDGAGADLMVSNLQNAVALDFDWSENMIYWSDVTSAGSNISRMRTDGGNKMVKLTSFPSVDSVHSSSIPSSHSLYRMLF